MQSFLICKSFEIFFRKGALRNFSSKLEVGVRGARGVCFTDLSRPSGTPPNTGEDWLWFWGRTNHTLDPQPHSP